MTKLEELMEERIEPLVWVMFGSGFGSRYHDYSHHRSSCHVKLLSKVSNLFKL